MALYFTWPTALGNGPIMATQHGLVKIATG